MEKIELHNLNTGMVVRSSDIRALVSEVKFWVRQGLTTGQFMVAKSPNMQVSKYLRDIVRFERVDTCDLCGEKTKVKNMVYHCDQYDVCLVAECKKCNSEH